MNTIIEFENISHYMNEIVSEAFEETAFIDIHITGEKNRESKNCISMPESSL